VPHLSAVIGAMSVATSCFALVNSESGLVVGIIHTGVQVHTIEAPDTVRRGAPFSAIINTFGSAGCSSADGVKLALKPTEARVTPYDRVPTGNDVACTADVRPNPHPVTLHFTLSGAATIVAVGMVIDETSGEQKRGEVTKAVVVVP
jgi:hypothetical protein